MLNFSAAARVTAVMLGCLALGQAARALPIGLNIDVDFNFPGEPGTGVPASTYGAAAGQTGQWTGVSFGSGPFNLNGLNGAASGVTMSRSLIPPGSTIDIGHTGDYAKLVYDADRIDTTLTYTFSNLPAGQYVIYTYAAAPSFGTVATRITINGVAQLIAGAAIDGTFLEGLSHARHSVNHPGGTLTILAAKASINGVVNGFQFVPVIPPPPGAFSLVSPANGSTGASQTPTLAWNTSSGATSYTVTVDSDAAFTPPAIFSTSTTSTNVQVSSGLLGAGTQYFWRVTATNEVGSTDATPFPASFTTAVIPPPPPPAPFGLNIDVDFTNFGQPHSGVPAAAWGAVGAQPGTWASVGFGVGPFNLVGLNGAPSGATITRSITPAGLTFDFGATGNYPKLIYDADRIDGPLTYTISGLPQGSYSVYTYAAAPSFSTIATRVTINGSAQVIADAPIDGTFSLGRTHALHSFFHTGGSMVITVDKASINGAVNGFQIVPSLTPTAVITAPAACGYATGAVDIQGTANAPAFTGWTLEYTGGDSSNWVPIASGSSPVVNGSLAVWNASGLRPCAYTIRLRVTTSSTSAETMRSIILAIPGDVNLDGAVGFDDITMLMSSFSTP